MGALTGNRKRPFPNLYVPFSSHPNSDLTAVSSPPSKKPKIQSQPPKPNPTVAAPSRPSASAFPPVTAPLRRTLHAPQRIIKAFCHGSSSGRTPNWNEEGLKMGNFSSRIFGSKKNEALPLEDYKKLVVESDSGKLGLGSSRRFLPVRDLSVFSREEEEPESEVKVLNRKVQDARRVVKELVPVLVPEVREERKWVKKGPAYKELYEESKKTTDPTLSSLAYEVKLTEKENERLSAIRIFAKEQEEKPKEDVQEPFTPLTDEEEDEVSNALHGGSRREVLVTHEASNIEITRDIFQCLGCSAWLNDEVINVYLELLKERERRDPNKFLKCHFFNTFFYKKLIGGRNGYDYKAVRRWTTQKKLGYGLIDCDKIFVPIHKEVHWCLAVINVKDETFQYLDSLGGMDTTVLRVLARYFMDEVKDKSGKQIDMACWKQEVVDNLPLQMNGWDCGMFMLKYTDFYSRGLGFSFSQDDMAYFRKRTAKEILRLRAE